MQIREGRDVNRVDCKGFVETCIVGPTGDLYKSKMLTEGCE